MKKCVCERERERERERKRDSTAERKREIYYGMRNRVKENALRFDDTVVLSQRKEKRYQITDYNRYQITNRRGNIVIVRSPAGNTYVKCCQNKEV